MFDGLKKKLANFSDKLKQKIASSPKTTEPEKNAETPAEIIDAVPQAVETDFSQPSNDAKPIQEPANPIIEADDPIEPEQLAPAKKSAVPADDKRKLKAKTGIVQKIGSVLRGKTTIHKNQVAGLLDELELSLLEADVETNTATAIVTGIRTKIVDQTVSSSIGVEGFIHNQIKQTLLEILSVSTIDLLEQTKRHKPLIILVLGPNGAGKTTSIAKLTRYFQKNNKKVVWAAADTFRPASIEQLEKHGQLLGIRVIKHQYGADPAAVAFDAIASANSNSTDIVLIDSAGRQETNQNLMRELEKIVKVAKPHLKIMVAESYAGQSLLNQATEFNSKLGIDGFILTKMDADPKGGTLLSICHSLKKPVLFIGTGQGYEDLEVFDAKKIVDKII